MNIWRFPLFVVLFVGVISLAIKVVDNRHQARSLYTELHQLEKERDELYSVWNRLRTQKSSTLNRGKIERQARDNLNMKKPDAADIKVINE